MRLNSIRCSFPDGNAAEGNVIKSILVFFHPSCFILNVIIKGTVVFVVFSLKPTQSEH